MRRLIAILAAAALALMACGSEDPDPTGGEPEPRPTDTRSAVDGVTMTRSGGIAGVHQTWKVGPSDPGHREVFDAASPAALDGVDTGAGKPVCCDFFQYDLIVRYDDGSTATYRMYDGGAADPALERLVDAVLATTPTQSDRSPARR